MPRSLIGLLCVIMVMVMVVMISCDRTSCALGRDGEVHRPDDDGVPLLALISLP
ncbi:hypothetical protein BDR04DRAFT_1109637 [Suillus decipiens]|nr:hypothetical protein BDR04DRAFT_1109637 [Suillus decipiens]